MIKLGDRVQDRISKFKGIVGAKSEYLNGCIRFLVEPEGLTSDGEPISSQWFDDVQLKLVKSAALSRKAKPVGGPPRSTPPSRDP